MRKIILTVTALVLALSAKAFAFDDGDFQIWNTENEEMKINNDWKLALEQELRWGDNASTFYYQHYDIGFVYSFNKNWSGSFGYRHVLNKSNGKFLVENEPNINLTYTNEFAGFKFDTRSRLEYNHFDYKDDTWTYRNKFTIKAPWKFTKLQIQPYVADEIFVLFDDSQRLNKNRAFAGLGMTFTKNLKGEIYYMLQSSKGSKRWTETNVLGTKVKLSF